MGEQYTRKKALEFSFFFLNGVPLKIMEEDGKKKLKSEPGNLHKF